MNILPKQISEILFRNDPIGISSGNNRDEYDAEAQAILSEITKSQTTEEIHGIIYQLFIKFFGKENVGNYENYSNIAQEISNLVNKD